MYTSVRDTPVISACSAAIVLICLPISDITSAAADQTHWAFQPPQKEPIPAVKQVDRVRTPIDAFLLARLETQGLTFSEDTDRLTLMRRAFFDLIGLPPTRHEVESYLADSRPDAYERLIDRLLASPHYGERWGRHWLDVAGYVDNVSYDGDLTFMSVHEGIWRYRDYVIGAFNSDKPFNRFLIEQLAGDELVDWRRAERFTPRILELLTATGYLRSIEDHTNAEQYGIPQRYEVLFRTMEMVSTSLLGLTMDCCRCHDHKYDPISQRDYYRMMAWFEPALNVHSWIQPKSRFLADVPPKERATIDQQNAEIDKKIEQLQAQLKAAEEAKEADRIASLKEQVESLQGERHHYGKLQAIWDVGVPPASHVLLRGDVHRLGSPVTPGFPEELQSGGAGDDHRQTLGQGETSGRRLTLAHWLTRVEHPLTGRVLVNRVWHHHFGRGIVSTLGNFGRSGSPPANPELLDWLTIDLIDGGWSIKSLHRMIMLSTAYRQSSQRPRNSEAPAGPPLAGESPGSTPLGERVDPENRLLWRMNLRRLEAEVVRDSILAASGRLDRTAGGPAVEITTPSSGLSQAKPEPTPSSAQRRSLYLFARRVYPLKFLELFDAPIMPVNCTQRNHSATVLQSLALLNSEFLFEQSDHFARRVAVEAGTGPTARVRAAFLLSLGREPRETELNECLSFLAEQTEIHAADATSPDQAAASAAADLCHMLLSTNEFLYVE
jgi:hypothetical protein